MPRGTALSVARSMLKAEVGDFTGTNTQSDAEYTQLIDNMQKWLASEYDWPFLAERWNAACAAGQQFVAFPTVNDRGANTVINFERPVLVERYYNQIYNEIEHGIGAAEYNVSNIAKNQQQDPIRRWRMSTNTSEAANADQFEVWPVPVTDQSVRFTGQRKVLTVAADGDKLDFDDMLVVLLVAAEKLTRSGQPDAKLKLEKATRLLERQRQHYPVPERAVILGGGFEQKNPRKLVPLIIVR